MTKFYILFILSLLTLNLFAQPGTLDNTFDGDGILVINSLDADEGQCVAVDANNKILVGGWTAGTTSDPMRFTIYRLNEDGSMDNTFGTNGKYVIPVGDKGGVAQAITVLSDGKIIASGYGEDATGRYVVVVRLNADGTLDNTFDSDGIAKSAVVAGSSYNVTMKGLVVESDGKVTVAGFRNSGPNSDIIIARFNSDGSPDNSLDSDGLLYVFNAAAWGLSIDSNGKILLSGETLSGSDLERCIFRLNADGAYDNSFDGDGIKVISGAGVADVFEELNGKVVIVGDAYGGTYNAGNGIELNYLNSDGTFDNTFDADGKLHHNLFISNRSISISDVDRLDNRFIFTGFTSDGENSPDPCTWNTSPCYNPSVSSAASGDFFAVFLNSDGSLDNAVGSNGMVNISVHSSAIDECKDAAIDSEGRIVMAGLVFTDVDTYKRDIAVVRLNGYSMTGVKDKQEGNLKIYPNPGQGIYRLETESQLSKVIKVSDLSGREVFQITENGKIVDIDLTGENSGIYLVEIQEGDRVYRKRIMKR